MQSAIAAALTVLAAGVSVHATPGSSCSSAAGPDGGVVHTCVEGVYPLPTTGAVTLRPGDRVTLRFAAAPATVLAALVDARNGRRLAPLTADRAGRDWTIALPAHLPCGAALDVQATTAGDERDWWAGTRVNGCAEQGPPAIVVPGTRVLLRVPPGGAEVGPLAPQGVRWRLPSAHGCRVGLDARTTATRRLPHPLLRGRATMRWAMGRTLGVAWGRRGRAIAIAPVATGRGCRGADRGRAWRIALAAMRSARRSG